MVYQIADKSGVYCIDEAGAARVFYVAPEHTLIDAGMPHRANRILGGLAQLGVQPIHVRRIILTHHHWDHVGSLWELKRRTGAKVFAHTRDAEYINGQHPRRPPRQAFARIAYWTFGVMGAHDLVNVDVDVCVKDWDRIGAFTVIHTPGHTPGHICLLWQDVLFSGDLLLPGPSVFRETPHAFTADVPASRASIRKIAGLEFQAILAAHHTPCVLDASERVGELARALGMAAD